METLVLLAMFQTAFSYTAAIVVNICFSHDLIYSLRDPMRNPAGRYPMYKTVIFLTALIVGLVRICSSNIHLYGYFIQAIFVVYIGAAIISIIFAFRFVRQPGISSEARKTVVRVHITFVLVNIICQMYNIISRMIIPTHQGQQDIDFSMWYWKTMEALFFGQGLWLSIVRLTEPLYVHTVIFHIK